MKKRFLFPLIAFAAPFSIGAAAISIGATDAIVHIAGCNLGHQGACAELSRRRQSSAAAEKAAAAIKATEARKSAAAEKAAAAIKATEAREAEKAAAAIKATEARKAKMQQAFDDWKAANPDKVIKAFTREDLRECEAVLAAQLHDPGSLRVIRTSELGHITYSATNGFGARIQRSYNCSTHS